MWKIREDKLKELKTVDQLFDDKYGPRAHHLATNLKHELSHIIMPSC